MIFQSRTGMKQIAHVDNCVKKKENNGTMHQKLNRAKEPSLENNILSSSRCISGAQLHKCQEYIYECGVAHLNLCIVVCLCASLLLLFCT